MHGINIYLYLCRMDTEKKKIQMRKGVMELCILSLVSRGEMYSSDLLTALKESKLIVVEGTIYPLLTRLKNEGLLKYRWEESLSGPPRKYYSLTALGLEKRALLEKNWKDLVDSVQKIILTFNKK